jgi:8-oxo-dGTP pyrophosphatase MutT (NUDIX family)
MNTLFDTSSEEDEPVNNKEIPTIEPIPTQTEQKPTIQLQLTAPKNKMLHMSPSTCSNCGKTGHIFYQCKLPFTSYGIILFRINTNKEPELLMIRRKDTFGYIDFVRGKYSTTNRFQIQKCIDEMTIEEKNRIITLPFSQLWSQLWTRTTSGAYKSEESISSKKFEILRSAGVVNIDATGSETMITLIDMVHNSPTRWTEQEWEFPKGRRNFRENDIDCALREFEEETGINKKSITVIDNLVPYKEYFIGSNFKSYKHKFYMASPNFDDYDLTKYQRSEVSMIGWKTIPQCIESIRPYSLEKVRIVENIKQMLKDYTFYS